MFATVEIERAKGKIHRCGENVGCGKFQRVPMEPDVLRRSTFMTREMLIKSTEEKLFCPKGSVRTRYDSRNRENYENRKGENDPGNEFKNWPVQTRVQFQPITRLFVEDMRL